MTPFDKPEVEKTFMSYPEEERQALLKLRELIFDIANRTESVGEIEEALKWGQPSYLTSKTKSGTTIRLGLPKQGGFAIYTHCQTTIMAEFQSLFPESFSFDGNRAVLFEGDDEVPLDKLEILIKRALTYHLK